MRTQIHPLTGIRGFAAAWVVLLHIQLLVPAVMPEVPVLSALIGGGNLGVDLFFILSGFVIAYTYLDRLADGGSTKTYLLLRVARIYPAHLATLLVVALLMLATTATGSPPQNDRQFSPLSFVMNLFMMQAVPPALAWNDPAWSISTEFAAYLVFPLLVPLLTRMTPRAALGGAIALLAVGVVALTLITNDAHEWPYWSGYALMWVRIAICFPVGCLLYVVWRSRPAQQWRTVSRVLTPLGALGIIVCAILTPPAEAMALPATAYPFLAMLIFGAAGSAGWINRVLSTGVALWCGRVSYSVYLAHFPVLLVVGRGLDALALTPQSVPALLLPAVFALAVGGGAALYYAVEEPGRRLIRRLAVRPATRSPAD